MELFLGAAALVTSSLSRPTAEWLLFGREFPLGDAPVFCLYKVTNWFLFGERCLPFGKTSTVACFLRSLLTSSSLEKGFFFFGLGKETGASSIPFSCGASWSFCFFFFLVLLLVSSHTSSVLLLFSEGARTIAADHLFLLQVFLQLPSERSSRFLSLTHCLLHDLQILLWNLSGLMKGQLLPNLF